MGHLGREDYRGRRRGKGGVEGEKDTNEGAEERGVEGGGKKESREEER